MRMTGNGTLPLPPFYDPKRAAEWAYRPDVTALLAHAADWAKTHAVPTTAADKNRPNIHLLVIDAQKDFCFPEGTLYVGGRSGTGAMDDNRRLAEFIYRNLGHLSRITATLDTHFAFQIFFPSFWLRADGTVPTAHTVVTLEMVRKGEIRPHPAMAPLFAGGNYSWLLEQVTFYCERLEKGGRYQLYLWPPHCGLGSDGHALAGVIYEAALFHGFVRKSQLELEVKGTHPLTENYSIVQPEVLERFDGKPLAQKNTRFLETMHKADAIIVAGQAKSHCVRASSEHLIREIRAQDPSFVRKMYVLEDCMSSVAVPNGSGGFYVDYTDEADKVFDEFRKDGLQLVRSTESLATWPGINI